MGNVKSNDFAVVIYKYYFTGIYQLGSKLLMLKMYFSRRCKYFKDNALKIFKSYFYIFTNIFFIDVQHFLLFTLYVSIIFSPNYLHVFFFTFLPLLLLLHFSSSGQREMLLSLSITILSLRIFFHVTFVLQVFHIVVPPIHRLQGSLYYLFPDMFFVIAHILF